MVTRVAVCCVKAGPKYSSEYANKLYKAVRTTGQLDLPFVCFTDDPNGLDPGITPKPLHPAPRGWWHKLYLFNWQEHGMGCRILFFDLDMVVTGSLRQLGLYQRRILTAHRFDDPLRVGSTVMSIPPGWGSWVWKKFRNNAEHAMSRQKFAAEGDQRFIQEALSSSGETTNKIQVLFPGLLASYKLDCLRKHAGDLPPGTKLVSFHGKPNPSEVSQPWVKQHWVDL